jgi:hypothetical protein
VEITASKLRADIYRVLDYVIETGDAVDIVRKGRHLRITAVEQPSKLEQLVRRPDTIIGDPDDLVQVDWSGEWTPDE